MEENDRNDAQALPPHAALLGKAGLRMTRVVPTESAVSVVEAVPV